MKSEFEKFASGLSKEEIDNHNRLFRDVLTHLRRTRGDVFSFLQSRQPTLLITHNILGHVRDVAPMQRREIQTSIHGILENIRSQFSKEVSRERRQGRSYYSIPLHRLNKKYVEGLIERINGMAMKDAAADIVHVIASAYDKEIVPQISDSRRPSWRSEHYEPFLDQVQELDVIQLHHSLAHELYVDPDEVFDFLYDVVFEDGNTIMTHMFDEVIKVMGIRDVTEINQIYESFEDAMTTLKAHFKDCTEEERQAGNTTLSIDDPYWLEISSDINDAIDEIAYDLAQIFIRSEGGLYNLERAPSFQR